jgi:hypothetical protein
VARSAQHEVHVEQNHNGAGFLCTLRQYFQFNGIRMGSGRCVFSLPLAFEVDPFTAATIQLQGFDTFQNKDGQYNINPIFEDIPSINEFKAFFHINYRIKHIARRAYSGYGFNNQHSALSAIRTLVNIELR